MMIVIMIVVQKDAEGDAAEQSAEQLEQMKDSAALKVAQILGLEVWLLFDDGRAVQCACRHTSSE
jgi:hypothetical protein